MMRKKNAIALGIAALIGGLGFASGASAGVIVATGANGGRASNATDLQVNTGGIGHSLLFPYYTVQNGNATMLNIVNTDTVNGKAVKVRFRAASNSDDVFDFQLFLSPGDVWAASVSQASDGRAQLMTADKSCTLPATVNGNFVLDRLPAQIGDERVNQSREGYVEVFTMADIPRTGPNQDTVTGVNRLYTAIKHVNNVPPCTASVMNTLVANPRLESEANALGMTAPTTGLFGNYSIINMNTAATSWTGEATSLLATISNIAIDNAPFPAAGNIVFFPQTAMDVTAPAVNNFTADPLFRTANVSYAPGETNLANPPSQPALMAQMFDLPDMSTPYLNAAAPAPAPGTPTAPLYQAQQLSAAIARLSIKNEILTDPTIDARTDWLFSMPTRRYSVAADYRSSPFIRVFSNLRATGTGNEYFTAANTKFANGGQICVAANAPTVYNREEDFQQGGFVISPGLATSVSFCGEVSVLSFNATGGNTGDSVLSARVARQDLPTSPRRDGWADLATPGLPSFNTAAGASPNAGLPILGRAFVRVTNTSLNVSGSTKSANFGGSWEHRFTKPLNPVVTP